MAKNEAKVMDFVAKELDKNPSTTTTELFEKAKKMDTGVAKLSIRQFNARYPLQVKRRKSIAAGGGRRGTAKRGKAARGRRGGRDGRTTAMRAVLLKFATDLAGADQRSDLITVMSRMDDYVADALKAAGR